MASAQQPAIVASAAPSNDIESLSFEAVQAISKQVLESMSVEIAFIVISLTIALSIRTMRGATSKKSAGGFKKVAHKPLKPTYTAPVATMDAAKCAPSRTLSVTNSKDMDLAQLVENVIATRLSTARALASYTEMRANGRHRHFDRDLQALGSKHSALDFYVALVQCAGRAGRPQFVEVLLDDMADVGIQRPLSLYESAMRLLAGKQHFKEAISVYDRLERDGLTPSSTTLSCLVGFAAEIGQIERAVYFFEELCKHDAPSIRACMSILRVHAKRKDFESSLKVLHKLSEREMEPDSIVLNLVLSTAVSVGEGDRAEAMLGEEPWKSVADVVSYNIVLKGFAQQGQVQRTLSVLYSMPQRGVEPNLITFNTSIDAAVRANRSDDAWRLYDLMVKEGGMQPDKCTCSTLVKGFFHNHSETEERVAIMLSLYDAVKNDCSSTLRNSLLSGCIEAAARLQSCKLAMSAFMKMREQDFSVSPAEVCSLLRLHAQSGDSEGCRVLWSYAADLVDFQKAKQRFDRLLATGLSIHAATLGVTEIIDGSAAGSTLNTAVTPSSAGRVAAKPTFSKRNVGGADINRM